MQFDIEMVDDRKYRVKGTGTVLFERESENPLYLVDVIYVPRLKKNHVSVAALEDKGYEVIFTQSRVFIKPSNSKVGKHFGVRHKIMYIL